MKTSTDSVTCRAAEAEEEREVGERLRLEVARLRKVLARCDPLTRGLQVKQLIDVEVDQSCCGMKP